MRYAIIFESKVDADKLGGLLKQMRIQHVTIEMLEDSVLDMYTNGFDQMRELLIKAYATPVEKLQDELERAKKAFAANPTPSGSSIIKRLQGKLRYAKRQENK